MIATCINCGVYHEDKIINIADSLAICPACDYAHAIRMKPLFVITGASGTGKSTLCYHLMQEQTEVIAIEGDIYWRDEFNSPENDYYEFRNLCLRTAFNIQQGDKPVVLCGTSTPGSYEKTAFSRYFTSIHYLALICDDAELEKRLKARPEWRNANASEFVQNTLAYNQWYKDNVDKSEFDVTLADTTQVTISETTQTAIAWMSAIMQAL